MKTHQTMKDSDQIRLTDEALLQRIRTGDKQVIKYLYSHAFHTATAFVSKNRGDIDDAKDFFQEALMVLYRNTLRSDFQLTCNVSTYLYSVVRNLWLKHLNKEKKGGLSLIVDENEKQEFVLVDDDEIGYKKEKEAKYQQIAKALKSIKEDCRRLLTDFYFRKISLKEIATLMGYTSSFVKVKKNRCMQQLKSKIIPGTN